jgi:hypothetical protein
MHPRAQVPALVALLRSSNANLQARSRRGEAAAHASPRLARMRTCARVAAADAARRGGLHPRPQQNACAALTGLCGSVAGARDAAAAEGAAQALVTLLSDDTPATVAARANALETVAALAAEGGLGSDAALVAGAPAAVCGAQRTRAFHAGSRARLLKPRPHA